MCFLNCHHKVEDDLGKQIEKKYLTVHGIVKSYIFVYLISMAKYIHVYNIICPYSTSQFF